MTQTTAVSELGHINHLKKFLNFVGLGVVLMGNFYMPCVEVKTKDALLKLCDAALLDHGKADQLYPDEPLKGLVARPNCRKQARLFVVGLPSRIHRRKHLFASMHPSKDEARPPPAPSGSGICLQLLYALGKPRIALYARQWLAY